MTNMTKEEIAQLADLIARAKSLLTYDGRSPRWVEVTADGQLSGLDVYINVGEYTDFSVGKEPVNCLAY